MQTTAPAPKGSTTEETHSTTTTTIGGPGDSATKPDTKPHEQTLEEKRIADARDARELAEKTAQGKQNVPGTEQPREPVKKESPAQSLKDWRSST